MRAASGFTLVEVLTTLALAALLLALVGALLVGGKRHGAATESAVDAAAMLRLAGELLREELRLAGAAPWPRPAAVPDVPDVEAWLAVSLRLTAAGDSIRVRYVDHRLLGGPEARDLAFEAARDGAGEAQLYRRQAGAPRQPLVAGVDRLAVRAVVDAAGRSLPVDLADGLRVAALVVDLVVGASTAEVVVELPAKPLAEVAAP